VKPPDPYTARPATPDDAKAIAAVVNACEEAYSEEPDRLGDREVGLWLDRAAAAEVVLDDSETVVAVGTVTVRGPALGAECFVQPDATRRGLGSFLLDWSERQARQGDAAVLRTSVLGEDEAARELVVSRGFVYVRSFYRMLIDLAEPPPAPQWPAGIDVAALRTDEDRLLYDVVEDSFAEHWGHVHRSFEEWRRRLILEPDLTFLACGGDEVVGAVVCNEDLFGSALVAILGVRKPWRGRGLGRALLLHGFGALYEIGKRRIGLGVDAGNETGALGLYESVGMRIGGREDVYEQGR
jgi:mycothiol synthase